MNFDKYLRKNANAKIRFLKFSAEFYKRLFTFESNLKVNDTNAFVYNDQFHSFQICKFEPIKTQKNSEEDGY